MLTDNTSSHIYWVGFEICVSRMNDDFLTFAGTDDHDQLYFGQQKSDERFRWWSWAYSKVRVGGGCIIQ